jgi:hypothetical protein
MEDEVMPLRLAHFTVYGWHKQLCLTSNTLLDLLKHVHTLPVLADFGRETTRITSQ